MSIASEISRLQQAKADIKDAIEDKGVTVPTSAKLDTYDDYIAQISGGSSQGPREVLFTYRTETTTTDQQTNANVTSVSYADSSAQVSGTSEWFPSGFFTSIGDDKIVEVSLPSDITKINTRAFSSQYTNELFTHLTTIKGLDHIIQCNSSAFKSSTLGGIVYMPNLQTLHSDGYQFYSTNIIGIDNLGSITSIPYYTFQYCTALVWAILPNTITTIGMYAFNKCTSLTTINIDELTSLTTIDQNAFDGNGGGRIAFPAGSNKKLPTSITSIGDSAFRENPYMRLIVDLPLLTYLGDNAFYKTGITSVVSLGSITSFSDGTSAVGQFHSCTNLTDVTLPSGFTSIGNYTFYGCTSLASINFPNSLTKIGQMAFQNTKLTSIDMSGTEGNGLTLYNDCFRGVTTLSSTIKLPKDIIFSGGFQFAEQGGNSYNSTTASTLDFDLNMSLSTVTSISACTFYRSKLTKITSLGIVTTIAAASSSRGVFEGSTYLTEATLPSTLTSLGTRAFYGCTHLTTLTVLATTPPTFGSNALYNTTALEHIYVPSASVATYQATSGWSSFSSKIEAIPE